MKKGIAAMIVALICSQTFAQKIKTEDVPATVKVAFQKQFPNAKVEGWEKEGKDFEVHFELAKTEQSALYDKEGQLIETEIEIASAELPTPATQYIKANFPKEKIKEAAKIIDAKGVTTYEAEIKDMDFIFDATGNFIKHIKN